MSRLREGEKMNQLDAQTVPNHVTCPCQHCNGGIEVDAAILKKAKLAPWNVLTVILKL
jgi:hypothetical protein